MCFQILIFSGFCLRLYVICGLQLQYRLTLTGSGLPGYPVTPLPPFPKFCASSPPCSVDDRKQFLSSSLLLFLSSVWSVPRPPPCNVSAHAHRTRTRRTEQEQLKADHLLICSFLLYYDVCYTKHSALGIMNWLGREFELTTLTVLIPGSLYEIFRSVRSSVQTKTRAYRSNTTPSAFKAMSARRNFACSAVPTTSCKSRRANGGTRPFVNCRAKSEGKKPTPGPM